VFRSFESRSLVKNELLFGLVVESEQLNFYSNNRRERLPPQPVVDLLPPEDLWRQDGFGMLQ
jgi:hypothetical protein